MGLNKRLIDQVGGAAGVTNTDNFSPVTYTGTGSTQSITSLDFAPDLVWVKSRGSVRNHMLSTSVQQQYNYLSTNLTNAEATSSARITSLDSNGFTVGTSANVNSNGVDYVAWCWKAGGTAVSNTDGSITSTVSANQDAGFSIVGWNNSTSGTGNFTLGHGLSSTPELIIVKSRDTVDRWTIYSAPTGAQNYLQFSTAAVSSYSRAFPVAPTSSVFTLDNGWPPFQGDDMIAYCFHSVDGYQKIGTYTSSYPSTTSVNVGFQPRFVMIKSYNQSRNWVIHDSARTDDKQLYPNLSNAEADTGTQLQFTSTGFDVSGGSNDLDGGSSYSYIYLAIA